MDLRRDRESALPPSAVGCVEQGFDEYVLHWRYLTDDNVEPIAVDVTNYSEMFALYSMNGRPAGFVVK